MQVLTFASQKGGSGKTTLAGHVAVEAERIGVGPVAVVDTDPQGSLADWWNVRSAETPVFVHTSVGHLPHDLEQLAALDIALVVIDTPPAITATIEGVIAAADLVAIPTRPSPHDLRSAGATVELAENAGKPLVFVVNGATPRARITAEAAVALSQHGTVAPVTVHQRTDFAASMIDGRTVMDLNPSSRSSREVAGLWTYLATRLQRGRKPTMLAPLAGGSASRAAVGVGG